MKLAAVPADYTSMSNSDLDSGYSAAYYAGDSATYTAMGDEIAQREAAPVIGFVENLFGTPFPKYDAIRAQLGYFAGSTAAPAAVSAAASNVGSVLKGFGGTAMLAIMASGAIALAYLFRGRK